MGSDPGHISEEDVHQTTLRKALKGRQPTERGDRASFQQNIAHPQKRKQAFLKADEMKLQCWLANQHKTTKKILIDSMQLIFFFNKHEME